MTAAREAKEETLGLLWSGSGRSARGPILWFPAGAFALVLQVCVLIRGLSSLFLDGGRNSKSSDHNQHYKDDKAET